jgi:hypothetical protein
MTRALADSYRAELVQTARKGLRSVRDFARKEWPHCSNHEKAKVAISDRWRSQRRGPGILASRPAAR